MRGYLSKVVLMALLIAALVGGAWRFTSAGQTDYCAVAGGDHGGGCNGCWVVATGTEEGLCFGLFRPNV